MASSWPNLPHWYADATAEANLTRVFEIVTGFRALRHSLDITPMKTIPEAFYEGDLGGGDAVICGQGWVERLTRGKPAGRNVAVTREGVDLYIPIEGLVDAEKMRATSEREIVRLSDELSKLNGRLANPQFVERAKPEVLERDRAAAAELESRLEKARERLALFGV